QDPAARGQVLGAGDGFAGEPAVHQEPVHRLPPGQRGTADPPSARGRCGGAPRRVVDAHAAHLPLPSWPGSFNCDRSIPSSPGGSSSRPFGIDDRSGIPPGMPPGKPPLTLGGVGPRLPFFPFLPFLPRLFLPLPLPIPPGPPMRPAIADIILRASKKRSTSWLTSVTVTPEPFAMRNRREPL